MNQKTAKLIRRAAANHGLEKRKLKKRYLAVPKRSRAAFKEMMK